MSAQDVVYAAQSQVGYLEKASNKDLDSFTANPGNYNWTKYGKWYGLNPAEWCDMFVSWCAYTAGESSAVSKFAYVPSHRQWFQNRGQYFARGAATPKAGDIIFFGNSDHIGIVESCYNGYVHTIEGNTKNSAGQGGCFRKSYALSNSYIQGYARPAYSNSSNSGGSGSSTKTEDQYSPWRKWSNGSTVEAVFRDSDLKDQIDAIGPYKSGYCMSRYGEAYAITYKIDGTSDDWAIGWVKYSGGVS